MDCRVHPDQPADCPTSAAEPMIGVFYRAIKGTTAVATDFISEAEKGRETSDCNAWGLSIWVSAEGVETARLIVPGFRKKCIVEVEVGEDDGVILHTPADTQPQHHTFWRDKSATLHDHASIYLPRNSP